MRPFSLFILLNVAFFFVQPYTGLLKYSYTEYAGVDGLRDQGEAKRKALYMNYPHFVERFDATLSDQKKSLLLVAIPVFALSLIVLYARSGRVYVEHLVFAVHAYAFMVFYMTAMGTLWFSVMSLSYKNLSFTRPVVRLFSGEAGVITVLGAGMLTYLALALHRFYGTSMVPAVARAFVLFILQTGLIIFFRTLLFHTTLAAL